MVFSWTGRCFDASSRVRRAQPGHDDDTNAAPVAAAILKLLALGENAVGAVGAAGLATTAPPSLVIASLPSLGGCGLMALPEPLLPPELTLTMMPLMSTPAGLKVTKLPPHTSDTMVDDSRTILEVAFRCTSWPPSTTNIEPLLRWISEATSIDSLPPIFSLW